jgi:FkbM family methyltransferase
VAALVVGGVVLAAALAVGVTWVVEKRRDLVAEVPGLGKFVIRDPGDVIQSHLLMGKPWEPESVAVFEKYVTAGMSVADIGAYNGVHTVRFAKLVGPTGHVYAFEPNPASFEMLSINLGLNGMNERVVASPVGLAEKAATARLFTAVVHNQGGTVVCSEPDIRDRRRGCDKAVNIETRMIRIDDDVQKWFPTRVGFAKIDVEGYEDRVLAGAKGWIARDRPLIWIEIWDDQKRALENMPKTSADTIALIQSLGYRAIGLIPPWDYLFAPVPKPGDPAPAGSAAASATPAP